MRKRKVQWLAAACVFCLAQPVWAATESTTVYQDQLDSVDQSYLGEISKASTPDNSNIRVVRRGEKAKPAQPTEQLPTRIDADKMSYTGSTGDVYAQGDVVVTQGNQTLMSPRIEGNTKTTEYRTVGGYRFLENGGKSKDITGQNMTYRTSDHHFTADQAFGWNDPYYVKGQNATFDGETGHMEKGMVTTKHAMAFKHTPDYRVEGQDIKVYPGDKVVIKKPSFYIKNFKVLSLPSYTASLRHDKEGKFSIFSLVPKPTYSSDDGIGLHGSTEYPIGKHGEAYIDYRWYSKSGFKPKVGYRHYLPWATASIGYSKESNEYNDETVKGSHKEYYTEVSHDPIKLWKNADLRFLGGYQRDYYGYNGTIRSMPYWGARFQSKVGNRANVWVSYNQRNISYNNSPYRFDTTELPKELIYGGSYKLTRLDDLSVSVKTNMMSGDIDSVYYTWHRDLHSFDMYLTYKDAHRSNNDQWKIKFVGKDF